MKRVRTPGLGVVCLLAAASVAVAAEGDRKYSDLPGAGKPVRAGYVVTTEGGVDGTQSVYYAEGESRKGKGTKLDPNDRRGMGPVATAERPGVANSGGSLKDGDTPMDLLDYSADPVVGSFSSKEENLSERRYDRNASLRFGKEQRFDDKGRPDFGRWGREDERRDRDRSESFGAGERYDTSARPDFGRWGAGGDRFDREAYGRGDERADVRNWKELFSRDKNDRFSDHSTGSPLSERMNDTLSRIHAYERASMQSINRTAFRRSHSDTAGELPVAPVGKGAEGVKPMRASK